MCSGLSAGGVCTRCVRPTLAADPLTSTPITDSTTPDKPATGNILDSVDKPAGTNATVTSFLVPGSSTPVVPGSGPVPVVDPVTGLVTGTLTVKPDGSYVFDPAPGFSGPVPPVQVTVTSSDGQSTVVPLSIVVDSLLRDGDETYSVVAGSGPLVVNLMDNVDAPAGTTANVTSFTLPGSAVVYPTGPEPVPVLDPVTGMTTGTIVVLPNGTATFTPAPGFSGNVPSIQYTVESSDGQVNPSVLDITVTPRGSFSCLLACPLHSAHVAFAR